LPDLVEFLDEAISLDATVWFLSWVGALAVLWAILPAPVVQGTELRDGTTLEYRINGKNVLSIC
jgi:hypothetical protein